VGWESAGSLCATINRFTRTNPFPQMSLPSGLSWEDTRGYLHALDTLLVTTPDTDALAAWRIAKSELAHTLQTSQANTKRLLQELQAALNRAESSTSESALPLEELRLRLEQVETRKAGVLDRVQRMTATRDASAATVQRLLQETLSLREEQKRLEAMKRGASPTLQCVTLCGFFSRLAHCCCCCCCFIKYIFTMLCLQPPPLTQPLFLRPPTCRHQLALYFNLTGIKWDYTVESGMEGYISPTNGLPPRNLKVDPRGLSATSIADRLWAEVGEAYRLPPRVA